MDILHLVDRFEELLNQSRPVWFTHNVVVDEDRMLDIIDQMRVAVPDEVKKAQQLLAQRDRLLAQAQEEANRTLAIAREKSDQLVERDAIVQAAQARGDQVLAQARLEADKTRQDADNYVVEDSHPPGNGDGPHPNPDPQRHPYAGRRKNLKKNKFYFFFDIYYPQRYNPTSRVDPTRDYSFPSSFLL